MKSTMASPRRASLASMSFPPVFVPHVSPTAAVTPADHAGFPDRARSMLLELQPGTSQAPELTSGTKPSSTPAAGGVVALSMAPAAPKPDGRGCCTYVIGLPQKEVWGRRYGPVGC